MLKQRILTAALLIPPFVAALFFLSLPWLSVLFGLVIAAAAWEWATLSQMRGTASKAIYVFCLLSLGSVAVYSVLRHPSLTASILVTAMLWWLWALVELISRRDVTKGMFATMTGRIIGGFLVLIPPWVAAVYLLAVDQERPQVLLFLFVLVWMADTAAYFAGALWGRTKLAPQVSPGKTVEGVIGGVMGAVLLAWVCGTMVWKYETRSLVLWIAVAAVTALISVVGDLTESKLKRLARVKDSGRLIPGHGGVLDRIDALTAAAPVFVVAGLILMKS